MQAALIDSQELIRLNERFSQGDPREIIRWADDQFGQRLIMTSSFGAESMCCIHLATQVKPDIKIVVVNTGYLFPETLAFMQQMRSRFNLNVWEYHTRNDPVVWLSVNGEPDPRYRNNVDACCGVNKNEVFDRSFQDLKPDAWIRGVRADQSEARASMLPIQWSVRSKCYAISPILKWSSRDIWLYMKEHGLPYNPLWDRGYTSIGCNPLTCTRAVGGEDDQRSGRWTGTDKTECGIHLDEGAGI
jgi:phosphoadenosine phosphosulfate reductase